MLKWNWKEYFPRGPFIVSESRLLVPEKAFIEKQPSSKWILVQIKNRDGILTRS
jgi:hypothetical protein